jgi:two-component system NtrC family sensor kinase
MLDDSQEELRQLIFIISKEEGIRKIRIFNKDGLIIQSSDDTDITKMVDKKAEACYVCHKEGEPLVRLNINNRIRKYDEESGHKNLGIIHPIYNEKKCWDNRCHAHEKNKKVLGVLDIIMSLEEVDMAIVSMKFKMVLLTIVVIFIISVIVWLVIKQVLEKPLAELVKATYKVAEGDFSYKINSKSKTSLGVLSNSFDEMTQRLSDMRLKLYQFNKLASLGRLAGGVAHEINNPLTAVLTYSSFILKRVEPGSEAHSDLEVIVRETKRCREIVKGLLDFARQAPPKKILSNICEIIDQSLSVVSHPMQKKGITLVKNLEKEKVPEILLDRNQMVQVFINLFVNAIDAIENENGKIEIKTNINFSNEINFFEVSIADNGMGIKEENFSKIFEPFYSTKGRKGTGLGLAVVWGIIDQHSGLILVDSKVGKGTVFTLRLPVPKNIGKS